jgi:hypothetical protein
MNTGTLMKLSSLLGLAAGCSHVLGMDENHPVLDCNQCPAGYQCDQAQVACVVIEAGTSGGHSATSTSEALSGGQGGSATSTTTVTNALSGGAPTGGYASASGANANATTTIGGSSNANGVAEGSSLHSVGRPLSVGERTRSRGATRPAAARRMGAARPAAACRIGAARPAAARRPGIQGLVRRQ